MDVKLMDQPSPVQPFNKENAPLISLLRQNQSVINTTVSLTDPTKPNRLLADKGLDFDRDRSVWRDNRNNPNPSGIDRKGRNGYFQGVVDTLVAIKTPQEQRSTTVLAQVTEGINLVTSEIQAAKVSLLEGIPGNIFSLNWVEGYMESNPELAAVVHNLPKLVAEKLKEADATARSQAPEMTPPIHKHKLEVLTATMGIAEATIIDVLSRNGVTTEVQNTRIKQAWEKIMDLFIDYHQSETVSRLIGQKATQLLESYRRKK